MKKYFIVSVLAQSLLMTNGFAEELRNDFCSKLPGHWKGEYTLKDQKECQRDDSCTQQFELNAAYVSGSEYQITLKSRNGQEKIFSIKCENGIISPSFDPNGQINASCNELNRCLVSYNDANVTSEILKSV